VVSTAESPDGAVFAVKITPHKRRVRDEYAKRLQLRDSPFLVRVLSVFETPTKALLQMELCERGDLAAFPVAAPSDIRQLAFDIGGALGELHDAGWMHLDVSPSNILVARGGFKLADFGTLTRVGAFAEGGEGAGPYVSPEALAFPGGPFRVGPPTDVFSFGVVLLEAASGALAPRGGSAGYARLRRGFHARACLETTRKPLQGGLLGERLPGARRLAPPQLGPRVVLPEPRLAVLQLLLEGL